MKTVQEIMEEITPEELELWAGGRRKVGKPSNADIDSYKRRDAKIVEIAIQCTERFSQSIRHVYYLCSGIGLVRKDHGKETYWYEMVKNAIGEARWNGTLAWHRIADDSRPFHRPTFWSDSTNFMESVVPQFSVDRWEGQDTRVIVCVEKDAIMSMLKPLCEQFHVPIMSFHGQASDGGGVHELAEHIARWSDKCRFVQCYYLGDFDTCGCHIDRVVFGDPNAVESSDEKLGKLRRLLWQVTEYADGSPCILYERIGIVPDDVMNPDYAAYLLESNRDTNFDRYKADTGEVEGFPMVEGLPATLGIDALDHKELIRRTRAAIKSNIDLNAWKSQRDFYKLHRRELCEYL
jgi:hypothetical protein